MPEADLAFYRKNQFPGRKGTPQRLILETEYVFFLCGRRFVRPTHQRSYLQLYIHLFQQAGKPHHSEGKDNTFNQPARAFANDAGILQLGHFK